jgi:hypothetical protein
MLKNSANSLKYTKYSQYHLINVWAPNEKREEIIKRRLLTDKNFKLTSLQVNPLYKPIFDKLDALAVKRLNELDKSVLWSRHYTKTEFKYSFLYPLIVFSVIILACINYGVRYRLYMNYIKYGRELELVGKMDIDLEDVASYPPSVMELYQEKKKQDAFLKRKEDKMKTIENNFHKFVEKRIIDTAELRRKRGLRVGESND